MKTEDSVEKFPPRSPFSFCDPGSRSAIRMEFSKGTASFPFHLRVEKLVPFHMSKNSHRKFHVNGKRSWFMGLYVMANMKQRKIPDCSGLPFTLIVFVVCQQKVILSPRGSDQKHFPVQR